MTASSKSAAQALAESPLAGLLDQARLLDRISSTVARFCQETASSDHSPPAPRCAIQGRTVIVTVANPSLAAKLRQRADALHNLLHGRVPEVTGIRIRLQLDRAGDQNAPLPRSGKHDEPPAPPKPEARLGPALRFAEDLARDLHDSPLRRSAIRLRATLLAKRGAKN